MQSSASGCRLGIIAIEKPLSGASTNHFANPALKAPIMHCGPTKGAGSKAEVPEEITYFLLQFNMAQRKYDQSLCRLRKLLRSEHGEVIDKVTIGSGCLVSLKSEGGETLNLITTTQVVKKNDLLSESSHGTPITVEFLDGRSGNLLSLDLNFNYKDAAESIPDPISGRFMPDTEELEEGMQQVSFIVIPVKKFDPRWWLKRTLKPLAKRSIPFSYETDEDLQTAISNRQVLCYVICDDRKSGGFYITEPSCLTYDKDGEFVLASTSDDDSVDHPKTIKDLPTEQKPKGALLLKGAGKFVGMLAVSRSEKRKLYPVFLPNLGESTYTLSKFLKFHTSSLIKLTYVGSHK